MDRIELKRRVNLANQGKLIYGKDYHVIDHGNDNYEIIAGSTKGSNTPIKKPKESRISRLGNYIKEIDNKEFSGKFLPDLKLSFQKTLTDPLTYVSFVGTPLAGVGVKAITQLPKWAKYLGSIGATGAGVGALQVGKNALTGDNHVAPNESAIIAGAISGVSPMASKVVSEVTKGVKNLAKPTILKNTNIEQLIKKAQDNNIILKTPGQDLSTHKALELEALASKGKLGYNYKGAMEMLKEAQEKSIANKIDNIVGGKVGHNSKRIAIESIKKRFNELKLCSQKSTEEAYKKVVPLLKGAALENNSARELYSNLKRFGLNYGVNKVYSSTASHAINRTLKTIKEAKSLLDLENSRRLLAKEFKYLNNPNKKHLMKFKKALDSNIDKVISNHPSLTEEGLSSLKNAGNLYANYMEKYVTPKNHEVAKFYKLLNKKGTTESEILGALNKDKASNINRIKRLKDIFSENSEEINHLKRAYVYDRLSKVIPEGKVLNIKEASQKIHQDFSTDIAKSLFSKEEISGFKNLANEINSLKILPKENINLGRGIIPSIVNDILEHPSFINPLSIIVSSLKKNKSHEEFKEILINYVQKQLGKEGISPFKSAFLKAKNTAKHAISSGIKGDIHSQLTN